MAAANEDDILLPLQYGHWQDWRPQQFRSALTGKYFVHAVAGGAQSGALTVLAERPPRNPDCLAAGGRGLRQAAHMPRCSFTRSASASLGGSSVSSLTRLPYLECQDYIRLMPCCHTLQQCLCLPT